MAAYSISARRRLGGPNRLEPPGTFLNGTNPPTPGQAIELRVDEGQLHGLTTGEAQRLIEQLVQELRRRILNGEVNPFGSN